MNSWMKETAPDTIEGEAAKIRERCAYTIFYLFELGF